MYEYIMEELHLHSLPFTPGPTRGTVLLMSPPTPRGKGLLRPWCKPSAAATSYLYVELGSPQQVEGGVPHGVRGEGHLLLQLLQAVPQLSSSAR